MALTAKTFQDFVDGQKTAIYNKFTGIIDYGIGSVLLSSLEANSSVATYLQRLILEVLARTRAATSTGADLDSFVADFGFSPPRFGETASTGTLTFSRFTNTTQALVPVGSIAQTANNDQFIVVADTTNPAYSVPLSAYVLAIGISSVSVLANSLAAGSGANALAGTITQIAQALPGVDTVTNAADFSGGDIQETDEAVRARFILWVASLSKATKAAVIYAASSFSPLIEVNLVENMSYADVAQPGYFYLVVYNGDTALSVPDIDTVTNLVDAVRPLTSTFGVFNASVVTSNINIILSLNAGYTTGSVTTPVTTAATNYINGLGIGQTLAFSQLVAKVQDASPGINYVSTLTINGGTANLTSTGKQIIKIGTVTIS